MQVLSGSQPDVSVHPPEIAKARFAYVRSLYLLTRKHWEQLKPTAAITNEERNRRATAKTPFDPASFWLNYK